MHSGFPSHLVRDARLARCQPKPSASTHFTCHSRHATLTGGIANFFRAGLTGFTPAPLVLDVALPLSKSTKYESMSIFATRNEENAGENVFLETGKYM